MTFTYLFSQVKYFITWYRKFTLCKASKNATNCVEPETPKWTWDMWQKDFDPSLHKNMSPFWWTKKRGLFLPPSLPYGPMSPSQQFLFLNASLILSVVRSQPRAPLGAPPPHIIRGARRVLQEGVARQDHGVHLRPVPDPGHREETQENWSTKHQWLRQGTSRDRSISNLTQEIIVTVHSRLSNILRVEETLDESGETREIFASLDF